MGQLAWGYKWKHAIVEQQPKRRQLGSSSRSGRNRGATVEADVYNWGAAVLEEDAIGEQQLKWTHMGTLYL